ncbi:uncharacterized protein LOC131431327 isoform X3 [Malaya genurostris]|uniref:uncharacterized protein LOC131431327 isoform X3 n=1 Tax=Malaya genurostris TaxID=325434 RepID=UPI0026F3BBF2|nr:uncharacterized protein LOC131431327 isoform X3 [Malaya genurostris]
MRNVWIVVASALLAFANFVKSQETSRTLYSSRYDNLDIDTILSSNRLVNNYVDCLLSRKPCPPEGKDLKRILPEALRTKCGRCSATQKENAIKIITTLYNNYPTQYQALRERWDPSGEYHRRLEEYIRGLQFNQIGSNGGNGVSPSDRPVRNDFDRDQSQILLQTLLLSTTTAAPTTPSPNVIPSGPQQRPQLAQSQITQPLPTVGTVSNRFGDDGENGNGGNVPNVARPTIPNPTTARPQPAPTTKPTVRQTTTTRTVTQRTTTRFIESAPVPVVPLRPVQVPVQVQVQVLAQRPQPLAPPAQAQPRPQFQPQPVPVGMTTPNNIIDNFFIPPGQGGVPANPKGSAFVGLFNQIGTKLATTADAIAGMLRKTVDVIVTSHLQAHQRAMRSY